MLPKDSTEKHIVRKLATHIPSFTDVFDEETFYIAAFVLIIVAIIAAFVVSRYVTIKDHAD